MVLTSSVILIVIGYLTLGLVIGLKPISDAVFASENTDKVRVSFPKIVFVTLLWCVIWVPAIVYAVWTKKYKN